MGLTLPRQVVGSAGGWRLADYVSITGSSDPAADGVALVELPQLDPNELWLIDHAVVACDSLSATSVRWYADGVDPLRLLDGSAVGNFDVADWPTGLQLRPSSSLLVLWTGASDGAIGTVTVQARSLRRG